MSITKCWCSSNHLECGATKSYQEPPGQTCPGQPRSARDEIHHGQRQGAHAAARRRDKTFWDDDLGGFGLRLRAGGSRNWVVQYDLGSKTRRVTLGATAVLDVGAARTKAKDLLAHVRLGGDPAAEKRTHRARAAETFAAILPRYLIGKQRDCRQRASSRSSADCGSWRSRSTRCPSPPSIAAAIASLVAAVADSNGPSAATNLHGTLSGYFSWLMGAGLLEQNPMLDANKPKPLPSRERVPTEDELRALGRTRRRRLR